MSAVIGVVTFPGSLDDRDAVRAVRRAGATAVRLWHADSALHGVDAVVSPCRELIGLVQERVDAVADEVGGRLEAREQEEPAQRDDLHPVEPVVVVLRGDEGRHEALGVAALGVVEDVVEVAHHGASRIVPEPVHLLAAEQVDVEPRGEGAPPGDELVALRLRQAEQLASPTLRVASRASRCSSTLDRR